MTIAPQLDLLVKALDAHVTKKSDPLAGCPPEDVKHWMKLEAEHTNDPAEQRKIVADHVREHGPEYYPALEKMERELESKK